MHRGLSSALALLALTSTAALGDPAVHVTLVDGVARVQLEGWYAGSTYTVYRADAPEAVPRAFTNQNILCLGDCYVLDDGAIPGHTYFYRFDLIAPSGSSVGYGPYRVLIPEDRVRVLLSPNPSRGSTRVSLSLPGRASDGPVDAEVRILDIQGRTIRVLHDGPLARGTTTLAWDGRGDGGRYLGAGLYFLHVISPLGGSTARIIRIR